MIVLGYPKKLSGHAGPNRKIRITLSHRVNRLPHTGSRMWIADLRGDRYFTHFEVIILIDGLHAGKGTKLHEK